MVDRAENFDSYTQQLLISGNPDFTRLQKVEPSRSSIKDGLRVENGVRGFIYRHGIPPWDRLGLNGKHMLVYPPSEPTGHPAAAVILLPRVDGWVRVEGTLNTRPLEEILGDLCNWVQESPLRMVEFPFANRTIQLMVSDPGAERIVGTKAELALLRQAEALPLPSMSPEECLLCFRTDAWLSPETGNPRWFAISRQTEEGKNVLTNGVNRPMVNCLRAMLQLGKEHFNGHHTS